MLRAIRRRRALRRAYRTDCQAVALAGFRLVSSHITDLSHWGASIVLDASAPDLVLGDALVVSFPSPRGAIIDASAEVRRLERDRAGLYFTELEWDARAALFVQLAGVPPPVPVRPAVDYAATVRAVARDESTRGPSRARDATR